MKVRKPTYLSFKIGKENYAVPTHKVLEVTEQEYINPVPNAYGFIEGVIAFRGTIVPVVNIKTKLKLDSAARHTGFIIIFDATLDKKSTIVAAVADEVNAVIAAADDEITPARQDGIAFDVNLLSGVVRHQGQHIMVFDIDKVLATDEKS